MRGYSSSNENPSGVQGVCPDGWHLPSEDEWIELIDFVAPDSYSKLIEGGTSGFDALLGGFHYGVVADPYFQSFEWEGYYWTCTYWGSDESHTRTFESWNSTIVDKINSANAYKWNHMSIRCIKDP